MEKIDFKKQMKELYCPHTQAINIVHVPKLCFLMIDGTGARNTEDFKSSWEALVRLAYTIKFIIKNSEIGVDYVTMPVEALWWSDIQENFNTESISNENWTLCIMQPEHINESIFYEGLEKTRSKKGIRISLLDKIRIESYKEGYCVQCLNLGPYDKKQDCVEKLRAYIDINNYKSNGKYHEIYIGDSKRARPENLKTIIRQPVKLGDGSQL